MKFKIEMDDFWLDEDDDLVPALKTEVTRDVINKITKSMEEKVNKSIVEKVEALMEKKASAIIDGVIDDFMATGQIETRSGTKQLSDHLKSMFTESRGWSSAEQHINRFSENFAKELTRQYDAAFANKIVINMKEQGLLKNEVVQILLSDK